MRTSPRVLLLVENNAYPFDFRVRREAQALRDAGYQVSVIAPRAPGQSWTQLLDGIQVYRFPAPPGGGGVLGYAFEFAYATFAMLLLSLWVAIRRGVDIVHAANPPDTLFVVGGVLKLFGKKFVFDHHDLSPEIYLSRFKEPRPNLVYRVLRLVERCTFAVADVVISTNESYRQVALDRGRKRAQQVFVVRNGPSQAYCALPPDPALQARARHLVGYIGMMGPQDGVDHWLRAVREIVHTFQRRDFLTVIIGDGDALPGLRVLARELDIERHVWFTGLIQDEKRVRTLLSTVAVCVQPDPLSPLNDKSTMNKVMEYMALGKPTVAFDLKETRHSAGESGVYARPNDEVDFARQVCWLLDHPEECQKRSRLARERFVADLAWEHSVPHLLDAYASGLGIVPAFPPKPESTTRTSSLQRPEQG